jgi:hypoxanthine phosphoribosyltransferase
MFLFLTIIIGKYAGLVMFEPNIYMENLFLIDRTFEVFISEHDILKRVKEIGLQISHDLKDENPVFIGILNGSFMFVSDLVKQINIPIQIQFCKVSSYNGTESTGIIKQLIGLNSSIENKTIVIIEDIIDTGLTITGIIDYLKQYNPKQILTCTLLLKPDALKTNFEPDYCGFKIKNKFVIGYGLDYNEQGRNLTSIYCEQSE